jgi:Flp pilus assembly pilin Flp
MILPEELRRCCADESGSTLAEYGLVTALLWLSSFAASSALSGVLGADLTHENSQVTNYTLGAAP